MTVHASTRNPRGAWKEAGALVASRRGRLALGLGLMLVNQTSGMVLPATSKMVIDEALGAGRHELLMPIALAVFAATMLQAASSFAIGQLLGIAAQRSIIDVRRGIQAHITRLPLRFFNTMQTGALVTRVMSDPDGIRNLIGSGLVTLAGGLIASVMAAAILFSLNARLTLFIFAVIACFGVVMFYAVRGLRPLYRQAGQLRAEVTGRLTQAFAGMRLVKAYTREPHERLVFTRGVHRVLRNVADTMTRSSLLGACSTVAAGAVGMLIILVGGQDVARGHMTPGDFVMYIMFVAVLTAPLGQMSNAATQVSEALAGLDRIGEVRRELPERMTGGRELSGPLHGDIMFDNVSFEYVPGVRVLKDVSFRAAPGTTTALVGPSGSGKTTLSSLVMAFEQPLCGRVLVDGLDLQQVDLASYRRQLGTVQQDNFLFDGTIADNIRYSKPDATMEEVRRAGGMAYCNEFVDTFEHGYDTIVGERGVRLSGGQRQRVAIARAILCDPRVLVLDEATSSLDSESEARIRDAMAWLRDGRTTLVIAHRLSTIRSVDQILVLDQGRIVERGTHAELCALGGRYRQLYDTQMVVSADRFVDPDAELLRQPVGTHAQ